MTVGIRHDDLRRRNRAMVIAAVRRASQPSRTEIAATTGLSHSTISAISADLIAEGILAETKGGEQAALEARPAAGGAGAQPGGRDRDRRRAVAQRSCRRRSSTIPAGWSPRRQRRLSTTTHAEGRTRRGIVAMLRRLTAGRSAGRRKPLRIVLAIQGITDADARTMLWSPITPHSDIPFADILEREFAIPTTVENDCNMMAVALALARSRALPRRFHRHPALARHRHGAGAEGRALHRHAIVRRRVRPHDPSARRRALPLRPARLRRGLCRQLCDLAQCAAEERELDARGRHRQRRHAGARRPRPRRGRSGARSLSQGRHRDRLRHRQPVRADRPGARRFRRRRRRRLRPAGAAYPRGDRRDRRRPAFRRHLLRHGARRTAAHPRRAAPCGR